MLPDSQAKNALLLSFLISEEGKSPSTAPELLFCRTVEAFGVWLSCVRISRPFQRTELTKDSDSEYRGDPGGREGSVTWQLSFLTPAAKQVETSVKS